MGEVVLFNREDTSRLEDKEDGELSDEGGESILRAIAGTDCSSERQAVTNSSETEIDRIIREAEHEMIIKASSISESPQIIQTPQVIVSPVVMTSGLKNMLDPHFLEGVRGIDSISVESVNEDLDDLRRAALKSMRVNGNEEEIRDTEVTEQIVDRGSQSRPRLTERIQLTSDPIEIRHRDSDYQINRRHPCWFSGGNIYERKRSRNRNRSITPDHKRNKHRRWSNNRSVSRERRRSRDCRDERDKRKGDILMMSFTPDQSFQEVTQKNRRTRSELDHQMLVLGNQVEDNHELVNMEVESEENTPPSSPHRSRQSIEDESTLRHILMEQINKKGKNAINDETSTPMKRTKKAKEDEYEKSRIELKQLDELMATRMKDIQKLNKQRLRQMKELQNTMESLTRFHVEYWKANERRKQIRPMIEKYEEDQIIEMTSNKSMTAFYRIVEEQSAQLSAIATAAQGRLLITPVPNSPIESVVRQSVYISPEQGEKDVDLSLAEINLRQILLKKQKSKATATERCDTDIREEPSTTAGENTSNPAEPSSNFLTREPTHEPKSPNCIPTSCDHPESVDQPTDRLSEFLKNCRLPLRLFPYAGLILPNEFELERTVCPFEISGKCKDCECEHRHLKDDKLKIREIVSMILWHAPSLAGSYAREPHNAQIDRILASQKPGEDRNIFLRNLLKPIVDASGILDSGLIVP